VIENIRNFFNNRLLVSKDVKLVKCKILYLSFIAKRINFKISQ
jgi:hypothetical protein